ncbi:MAG: ABC transporter substrate-binding protein [Spirochaetes bacterium]|nr:ABC transporter substrate-binding protein [Spirochaetota bacterium]
MASRIMTKAFVIALVLLSFAVPLFATGAQQTPAQKTVVTFWTDRGGDYLPFFKSFMGKYPNVDLQITVYQQEDYKSQGRLALSAGTGPDVWHTNNGSAHTQFIESGGAMDITDVAKQRKWTDRVDASSLATCMRNGKLYALPWGGFFPWQSLFANKDFFSANKIPYPKTVDELIEVCKQIRAKGMQPIAWGNKDWWPGQVLFGDFMMQLRDPSVVDALNTGKLKWTDCKEAATVFDTLAKLAKGGVFSDGYETQDHVAAIQAWTGKKAAFLYMGTWCYGFFVKEPITFEVETIALPLIQTGLTLKGVQLYPDPVIFPNAKTKVKEAALNLFDHLTSVPFYQLESKINMCFTASPEANKTVNLPAWLKSEVFMKQMTMPQSNYWTVSFPVPVEEVFGRQIGAVMGGQATAAQALQQVEQEHAKLR